MSEHYICTLHGRYQPIGTDTQCPTCRGLPVDDGILIISRVKCSTCPDKDERDAALARLAEATAKLRALYRISGIRSEAVETFLADEGRVDELAEEVTDLRRANNKLAEVAFRLKAARKAILDCDHALAARDLTDTLLGDVLEAIPKAQRDAFLIAAPDAGEGE